MNIHFCQIHLSFRSICNLLGLLLLHRQRKVSVRPAAASALSPVKIAFLALGHRVATAFFLEKVRLLANAPQDWNDRFSLVGQSAFHPRRDLVVLPAENKVVPDQLFQRGGKNRNPLISFRIPLYRSAPFSFSTQITRPVFPFPLNSSSPYSNGCPMSASMKQASPSSPLPAPAAGFPSSSPIRNRSPSLQTAPCIVPSASLKPHLTSLPFSARTPKPKHISEGFLRIYALA